MDLGQSVASAFSGIAGAIGQIPSDIRLPPNPTSNDLGMAGEEAIRRKLAESDVDFQEQVRFSDVDSQRGRRVDFQVNSQGGGPPVRVEVKNANAITKANRVQIGDYSKGQHLVLAVRKGAIPKIGRRSLTRFWLSRMATAGRLTVVECLFAF
jgi:hypothetical protein